MNSSQLRKVILLVFLVIILGGVYVIVTQNSKPQVFRDDKLGVTFTYPHRFEIEKKVIRDDPYVSGVILTSGLDRIAIAIATKDIVSAQIEKAYYKAMFMDDPVNKVKSSEVTIGGFDGYKTLFNFTKSQYFLYKQGPATSTIDVQVELNAADSNKLLDLENILREILTGMTLDK